jgi:mannitol-specific phosphotransferase system IIBC component
VSDEKKVIEEQNTEDKGFWTKNIISILLIVFLIVSGVYAFNRDASKEDKSVEEKVEDIKKEETEDQKNTDEEKSSTTEESQEQKPDIQKTESKIIVKANPGDGVTQLARKAIAEYSKDKERSLSKEQKLYAETNLKNEYYQHHLNVGQEVSFEEQSIAEIIQKAQNLSEKETKAWSKYVSSVPSL